MSLLNSVESASPSLRAASEPSEAAAQKLTRPDAIKRHWDIGVEVGELLSHDNIWQSEKYWIPHFTLYLTCLYLFILACPCLMTGTEEQPLSQPFLLFLCSKECQRPSWRKSSARLPSWIRACSAMTGSTAARTGGWDAMSWNVLTDTRRRLQATARNEEGSQHSGLILRHYVRRTSQNIGFTMFYTSLNWSSLVCWGLETVGQLLAEQVERADLVCRT